MTKADTRKQLGDSLVQSATLATQVIEDARTQWADYRETMERTANAVRDSADKLKGPTKAERAVIETSADAAASLADVFLSFAEEAFAAARRQESTRRKAANLMREVVRLAVDDALEQPLPGSAPAKRVVELLEEGSWQSVDLSNAKPNDNGVTLTLSDWKEGTLEVRLGHAPSQEVKEPEMTIKGAHRSLALRLKPKSGVTRPFAALLDVRGAGHMRLVLLVQPKRSAAESHGRAP